MKLHRLSCLLDDAELKELSVYARYKHIRGKTPVQTLLVLLAFQQMRAHAIPEARRGELEAEYDKELADAKAVQPDLIEGKGGSEP